MDEFQEILSLLHKVDDSVTQLRREIMNLNGRKTLSDDPLLPHREVLHLLDIKERQLRRYRDNGWIKAVVIQRRLFFRTSEVRNLIEKHLIK